MTRSTGLSVLSVARLLLAIGAIVVLAGPASAQQSGQISGIVTDGTGAVVPGVTVTAIEVSTGFRSTTVTAEGGQYRFPSLRPTQYEVTAELSGFRTFRRQGIELLANQSLTINVTIDVGALKDTVTVSGEAMQVDTTTSALSQVVDHARIVELPLNGRDVARLTTLVAGTVLGSVSTETGKSIPGGLRLSSNGSQERQVAYRLDGTSNTDFYFQENQTFPFPDALQEFSIQTSNYSAAQGNNAGAVVNVVTRSGTNNFHGGMFGYARDRRFNARNFFAPESDHLKRRQFGGFAGGPIVRNRMLFFAGWQGSTIKNRAADVAAFVPTFDQRNGNFATCGTPCNRPIRDPLTGENFPNNQIPTSRFDPASVALLRYIPGAGGEGRIQIARNIAQDLNQFVTKIDHQTSASDQLSVRYFIDHFDNASIFNDDNLLTYRGGSNQSRVRTQNAVVSWKRTMTPTLLNELHFGYNRIHSRRAPPDGVPGMQELGVRLPLYPTLPSIGEIRVTDFFNIGDNLEASFVRNGFELNNRTSWVRGRHNIQFGGELQYYKVDIENEFRRAGHFIFTSNVTGNAMADFFLGRMNTFDQGTGEYKNNRVLYSSLFVQDDYKVHRRFTLNLGVRYEPTPPWHETVGRIQRFTIADFENNVRSTQYVNAPRGLTYRGDPGVPEDGTFGDYNNVAARVGFALDLSGDGRTSLRGGGGMFYDQHLLGEFNNGAVNAPPWSIRLSVVQPQGPFSDPYRGRTDFDSVRPESVGSPTAAFPRPVLVDSYDETFTTPLNYNYNITFERELLGSWLARAAYVGSSSKNGRTTINLNPARYIPGSSTTGNTDARRLFAEYGTINYFVQDRSSTYNSMQLTLNRRYSGGFTVMANYTLAKSVGNFGDLLIPWFQPDVNGLENGPLDQDRRHRFVASWVWDIPGLPTSSSLLKTVLDGWQMSGIVQYQSGAPYTVSSGRDNSLDGLANDRAKFTGAPVAPPEGSDKTLWFNPAAFAINDVGTFGEVDKGEFYGPHLYSWDMGLFKNFTLTNETRLQFRAEFFNIFNQVNFNLPNRNVSGGGFGRITTTHPDAGDPRIIQFGLKLVF
jgi:Carboxypeptidase regulatory-like domain